MGKQCACTAHVIIIRYILGIPIAGAGVAILGLHLMLFVRGVLLRRHVSSPLPLVNFFILVIGFAGLPLASGLALGIALASADLVLWASISMFSPMKITPANENTSGKDVVALWFDVQRLERACGPYDQC